jgi:hypothetical protein
VEQTRQAPGAAAEIDNTHAGLRANQRQEIEEWLLALSLELIVLSRIPGVGGLES